MSTVKGTFRSPNVKGLSMMTDGQPNGLDGGLNSRTKVFIKSKDMIKFDEDEGDGGGGIGQRINGEFIDNKGVGSYQNVTSLYVHPDEENEIIDELADLDSLPGDDQEDDHEDLNEENDDIVGPLTPASGKVDLLRNSFYHHHRSHRLFNHNHHLQQQQQSNGVLVQGKINPLFSSSSSPSWPLTNERSCSLSSDALNQIMVNRGASSASNHSGTSPLSRSSSTSSSSQSASSEKVILLPRLTPTIKCDQINCADPNCPNVHLHNLYGLWSDKRLPILPIPSSSSSSSPITNNQVSTPDPNVLRLHVTGQVKLPTNHQLNQPRNDQFNGKSNVSIISPKSRLTINQTNGYMRLDSGQSPSSSSSSPTTQFTGHQSTGFNNQQFDINQQSNGKTTWRQCKNSSEVILVANQMDYYSKPTSNNQQTKLISQRRYGSTGIKLTADQALARYHRQFTCEAVSLIVLIIAVTFLIATPFVLIPIVAFPTINQDLIRVIMWLSLLLSIIFTIIGALIGNVYWYYDSSTATFKWRLHFGTGPKHYWGSTLFNLDHNQPSSINHNQQFTNHFQSSAIVNHV